MKMEHEVRLDRNEMSMIRWICGFTLKERKKNTEIRELLGFKPVNLVIKRGRLQWFGHVEHKDDGDWVKRCMSIEGRGDAGERLVRIMSGMMRISGIFRWSGHVDVDLVKH